MKNVLITGGCGFIGAHLAKHVQMIAQKVVLLDDFFAGRKELLGESLEDFLILNVDIAATTVSEINGILKEHEIDTVFHLAAIHFIPHCIKNPVRTFDVNVGGTNKLFQALQDTGVTSVVYTSSADVYPIKDEPVRESTEPAPFNVYGYSKFMNEVSADYFQRTLADVTFTGLRLFNVYGPGETNPHLLPAILDQLKTGHRLLELGNLEPKRDYVFVTDVVAAFVAASQLLQDGRHRVFNVGTGIEYSVKEVIELIAQLLGENIRVVQNQSRMRNVDRRHLVSDISKIQAELGWKPEVRFVEGLRKTLALNI